MYLCHCARVANFIWKDLDCFTWLSWFSLKPLTLFSFALKIYFNLGHDIHGLGCVFRTDVRKITENNV